MQEYDVEIFVDFKSFSKAHPEIAERFSEEMDCSNIDYINLYPTLEDYAIYEVEYGWYSELCPNQSDFRGAPNIFYFIDYEELGNALKNTWDESIHWYDPVSKCVLEYEKSN